jgi:transposase
MLGVVGNARIFLYGEPVNMRKSFEGLCAIVEQSLMEKPTSGAYFVFLNRQRDTIKVLYWDVDGLSIWHKRLEKGRFLSTSHGGKIITRREFFMLLEGVIPKRINPRYNIV